ncbi:PaaI family thioesterase [Thiosulfatihalobacter marinus]|uniref:PaaI family thioesterase n=1 Tax=Thiosulfatihalobacter marinus TaxID=2792481 RepID=UPI0018D716F3|nr:PaaI family thioesterase [Thiosulfatihalobacter marinus]
MTPDKSRIAEQFINAIPHCKALNMKLTHIGDGVAEMKLPYDLRIVGDPETGVVHGGAVSALMDTCCGAAAMSHPSSPSGTATIDLRIDYMRAATPGQAIRTRAECYHITRSVAFVRATALDDDTNAPVATATGAFTVEGL